MPSSIIKNPVGSIKFESEITVSNDHASVDGKSIMQMTMLAATAGSKLKITARGPDAEQAVNVLRELVEEKNFNEKPPKTTKKS